MPKKVKELSATEVRRLKWNSNPDTGKPYNTLHAVGGVSGLLLQVTPTDAKSWIYRTIIGGKRHSMGLGGYPDITLAQAREKARELKLAIDRGEDPLEEKRARKREIQKQKLNTVTFEKAFIQYMKMKSKEFKNHRQALQWENSITTYAYPTLKNIPVREIELTHIKAVLDPIWEEKTETAKRIQGRLENVLGWSAVHGYRSTENPAQWKGFLDGIYPSPRKIKKKQHFNALAYKDLPGFINNIRSRDGSSLRALEFLILTCSRTNEVIGDKRTRQKGATWGEIDFDSQVWTIPAERMKAQKEHKIPLCDSAIKLLKSMNPGEPERMIFTDRHGDIPSNGFMSHIVKKMGMDATVHGFRSTFKDWARECTNYPDEVSELALAHVNNDATRAAYARSQLIEKRRLLMNDWENFCNGQ